MARRRDDSEPTLLERVRWGNVGRLATLVAVGVLVATGPRGCGRGDSPAPVVAPPRPLATGTAERRPQRAGLKAPARPPTPRPRRTPRRHRVRTHRRHHVARRRHHTVPRVAP